ncbi:MAG: fumarate reductase/succinate dehydrogenase flavoprotein subunit [Thermodesulfobacteriota bacterium]
MTLDGKTPSGPIAEKWDKHRFDSLKLVNPANKRKYTVIVVGTGLAGASASASLGELGYNVLTFCYQESPRRAHSVGAQGGINAAKNYQNDGDSIYRLFYDTIKGGDFRSREANVYRLAQLSTAIIDICVAQGIPFSREYSGLLANRSFGGTQVSRTFYSRGQTGQQLLLGAYQSMQRQVQEGKVQVFGRREMVDLVLVEGEAKGIVVRNLVTGELESYAADSVVLTTGGYSTVFNLSTNAIGSNVGAAMRAHKKGAFFANPCYTQIHPTCIPFAGSYQSKLTLMSESLRNDGRVWVPKKQGDNRPPEQIPEQERDYYLERKYPSFGNLAPRDISSRAAKEVCDEGRGVGKTGYAVYLDFEDAFNRFGARIMEERYGNLFDMYKMITDVDVREEKRMCIYPSPHYTMGGLWVDYNLESNIPGLFVLGEANFSDHGANRLGASALMQGLADGYFIIPYTITNYLARSTPGKVSSDNPEFASCKQEVEDRNKKLLSINGSRTAHDLRIELGNVMWDNVGMARSEESLKKALESIKKIREEFWNNLNLPGSDKEMNQQLESAWRLSESIDFAFVMVHDALHRDESCGCHFRVEHQTPDGEAKRNDEEFSYVAAWEYQGQDSDPVMHKEPLEFEEVELTTRSYK